MLNVHPSLLPRWRGAAPIERAIMAGDERTGVSIMRLTAGLDSGPVCLAAERADRRPRTPIGSLAARLERRGRRSCCVSALDTLERGEPLAFSEQDERLVTYAEKIGPADRLLDPAQVRRRAGASRARAAPAYRRARRLADGTPARRAAARRRLSRRRHATSRRIRDDGRLLLGCADGVLELLEVQPPGKRPMDAGAFLRGHGAAGGLMAQRPGSATRG